MAAPTAHARGAGGGPQPRSLQQQYRPGSVTDDAPGSVLNGDDDTEMEAFGFQGGFRTNDAFSPREATPNDEGLPGNPAARQPRRRFDEGRVSPQQQPTQQQQHVVRRPTAYQDPNAADLQQTQQQRGMVSRSGASMAQLRSGQQRSNSAQPSFTDQDPAHHTARPVSPSVFTEQHHQHHQAQQAMMASTIRPSALRRAPDTPLNPGPVPVSPAPASAAAAASAAASFRGPPRKRFNSGAGDYPTATLNDLCPNVQLAALQDPDDLDAPEAQRRRLFLLTTVAACVPGAHVIVATTDDEDLQGNLYGAPGGPSNSPRSNTNNFTDRGHERIGSGGGGGYYHPPAALTAAPGSVPRAHRHARTASSGAGLAPSDGREARALTVVKRTVLDALPPNHRPTVFKLTEQTTRDDIANFFESAQSHSPGPSLTQMMSQRAPHQMRRQHGGHHQDARVVSHARTTSSFAAGPGQYRRGGHKRTVSVQSSDGGSQQMTPEPSYDAAFASSSAAAVQNSVSIDFGGPDSSEGGGGEGHSQGTSAAIQPRMSRRKSLAAEPADPAAAPFHTSPASLSAAGGPTPSTNAANGRCTATVASVVVAVGIHRLAPKVAASLSEFMITGLLPAASSTGAVTAPQAYPGITIVALTSDPMLPALPVRLRSAFTLSMTMSIARCNTALTKGAAGGGGGGSSSSASAAAQQGRGSLNPSAGVSHRATPTGPASTMYGGGTGGGGTASTPAGAGGGDTADRAALRRLVNHDLFLVLAAAKVTAKPQSTTCATFGGKLTSAMRPGENGAVVGCGPRALIGSRATAAPGVAFFRGLGRLLCNASVERYMRQHVALLRAVLAPHAVALTYAPLLHQRGLECVCAAALVLSRLSIDPAGGQSRVAVAGASVESLFELVQRAAVSPSTGDRRHVDPRYLPPCRDDDDGFSGRHAERAIVSPDDALCLMPHLLAHHVCVPDPVLRSIESTELTVRLLNSAAVQSGADSRAATWSGAATAANNFFGSPHNHTADSATLKGLSGGRFDAAASTQPPPPTPLTNVAWDAESVELAARCSRKQGYTGMAHALGVRPSSHHHYSAKHGGAHGPAGSLGAMFPTEPVSPHTGGVAAGASSAGVAGASGPAADAASAFAGSSTLNGTHHLSMSAQLQLEDTFQAADFAAPAGAFGRAVSFTNALGGLTRSGTFSGGSDADLTAALAAARQGGGGGGRARAHGRTFSNQSGAAGVDSRDDGGDSSRGGIDSPSNRGSMDVADDSPASVAVPWPGQLATVAVAPYSRCLAALCTRLLDNHSILRPPA